MDHHIKAVIFDLGKVVVNFDHMTACKNLSRHCPFDEHQIFCKIFESGLEADFDTGKIDEQRFCESIISEIKTDLSVRAIRRIWTSIFSLNPGMDHLIGSLKDRYRLLCLSNTNSLHFNHCLNRFDILKAFELFILSYRVGVKKPDHGIYHKALETAGLKAQECVYIDDIAQYTAAAEQIGITSIQFVSVNRLEKELHLIGLL